LVTSERRDTRDRGPARSFRAHATIVGSRAQRLFHDLVGALGDSGQLTKRGGIGRTTIALEETSKEGKNYKAGVLQACF